MTPDPRTEEIRQLSAKPYLYAQLSPEAKRADLAYLLGRIEALENVVDAAREYVTAESASDWIGRGEAETRIAAAIAALDGGEAE